MSFPVSSVAIEVDPKLLMHSGHSRGPLDRALASILKDPRDLPVLAVWAKMAVTLLPSAVIAYAWGALPWWYVIFHLLLSAYFIPPFTLALHVSSHRGIFPQKYRGLQTLVVWVLGPLVGQTPETYRVHHMGMHHSEENMQDDLSSTMFYQRDRWTHFGHYFLRFFFLIQVELGLYHYRRGRKRMLRRMVIGEGLYWVAVIGLLFVNPVATFTVFIGPLCFARFGMMAGNWAQHAFITPEDPANPYRNSITCIDSPYNKRCFNDGFHVGHHVKPNRHWSEMADDFLNSQQTYAEQGSFVFRGLDYFEIWWLLMRKRHDVLAEHLVSWPGEPDSVEAKVERIQRRLKPI